MSVISFRYLLTIVVLFSLIGCDRSEPLPAPIRPVRAFKVGDVQTLDARQFPGRARAKDEVELSLQVSGTLVALPVEVGSKVKRGEIIASIDPRDFQASLDNALSNVERARANLQAMERGSRPEEIEQMKAALEEAKATHAQAVSEHDRNARLVEVGAVSQSEFDMSLTRVQRTASLVKMAAESLNIGLNGARPEDLEAKRAEIRALEAAAAAARNQLDYTVLKAPFDGEVASCFVDNFQTVQAKEPIVRLLDVSKIEVTVQIPESLISLVPQVRKIGCRFDVLPGRELFGRVSEIGSEASETTRTYPVTVQIDQPEDVRILPGMAATVRNIPEENGDGKGQSLIVPSSSIFSGGGSQQSNVWIVDESSKTVRRRAVQTGQLTPAGISVTSGLEPGEWVVSAGVNSLIEGQQVKIIQAGGQ